MSTSTQKAGIPWRRSVSHRRFAALVLENRSDLVAYLINRGATRAQAEDCVQEALVRAYSSFGDLREQESARGWLFGIARHVFLDELRRSSVRRRREPQAADLSRETSVEDQDEKVGRKRAMAALEKAVEDLSPPKPEIVQLRYGAGLSLADIAETLSMPLSTVKTHLRRARVALRKSRALEEVTI